MIAAFVFLFLLAAAGATVYFVLSDFEQLADEGITFEVVPGYVSVDGISLPVARNRNFSHYMFMDAKIVLKNRDDSDWVFSELPFYRDEVFRELHRQSYSRKDGIPGLDIRSIKEHMLKLAKDKYGDETVTDILITKLILASN
jgi:hypothetical protein